VDEGVVVTCEVALAFPFYLYDIGPEISHVTRADRCRNRVFE
jgi:hypothetical protein